jgi:magnesium chelatase accessory protein
MVLRDGIRWHVQMAGSGPALLLVHGTGASSHSFRNLIPLLAGQFTVVAPDLPGHALSSAPPWFEPSVPGTAAALDELLLGLQLKPTVAVGHSAGAAVVARMALDRSITPRVLVGLGAALVPFEGVARTVLPQTARLLAMASRVLPFRIRDRDTIKRLIRRTGSSLDRGSVEIYARLSERPNHVAAVLAMMANWDLRPLFEQLPGLDVPFLLIAGRRDGAVPLSQQRAVVARLPRGRLQVLEGAGHLLHEERPEAVARLIVEAQKAAAG